MIKIDLSEFTTNKGKGLDIVIGLGLEIESMVSSSIRIKPYRKYLLFRTSNKSSYKVRDNLWDYYQSVSTVKVSDEESTVYSLMFHKKRIEECCFYKGRRFMIIYPEDDNSRFILWDVDEDKILSCEFERDGMDMPSLQLSKEWIEELGTSDSHYIIDLAVERTNNDEFTKEIHTY